MGVYLKPTTRTAGQFLQEVGMPLTPSQAEEVMWMPDAWLVAQVMSYTHKPAIVCNSENELLFIKRTIKTEERDVKYYLVKTSDLEGHYA